MLVSTHLLPFFKSNRSCALNRRPRAPLLIVSCPAHDRRPAIVFFSSGVLIMRRTSCSCCRCLASPCPRSPALDRLHPADDAPLLYLATYCYRMYNTYRAASARATYIHTARMAARVRALFSRYVMFERFDGCRMSHLVVPHDSVVRSSVRSAYGLRLTAGLLTNRAQI